MPGVFRDENEPDPRIARGRLLDFAADPMACMLALRRRHGNLAVLEEAGQKIAFVFGQELNQEVLSDNENYHSRFFAIRGPRHSAQRRLTSGIMSMNGDTHKEHRRVVKGPFEKKSIPGYHEPVSRMTLAMLDSWRPGDTRDIHVEMTRFMLEVTSTLLFGVDRPEFAWRLGAMIDRWVDMNHETGMGAFISDDGINEGYSRLLALGEQLEADIREMIRLRREAPGGADILSLLMHANEQGGCVSDDELIGHVALLYGAAHLTTANTLTWTLLLLAQHPAAMAELHAEIVSQMVGAAPTLAEMSRMPVTERVLKESMRILPASSYSQRITAGDVNLRGLDLPRGTPIVFSQYVTHHSPELFPEPEAYRSDRWLSIAPSPYAYLPFGAGAKMCIGAPLAMTALRTVLPAILKRFRLNAVTGAEISGKIQSTMLSPTTSVPMTVVEQDGRFHSTPIRGNIHEMVRLEHAAAHRRAA